FVPATATAGLCTLSLHDALPILEDAAEEAVDETRGVVRRQLGGQRHGLVDGDGTRHVVVEHQLPHAQAQDGPVDGGHARECPLLDRKSTRLNSSHVKISYAVFCL